MAPLKTVPFIAGVFTGFAVIFYILAASSNKYLKGTPDLVQAQVAAGSQFSQLYNVHLGAFFWCFYQYPIFNADGTVQMVSNPISGGNATVARHDECFRIDAYCDIGGARNPTEDVRNPGFSQLAPPLTAFNSARYGPNANFDSCPKFNAFRAFLMLGLVFAALTSTWELVLYTVASDKQLPGINYWGLIFGLLSGICGLISMAIFVAKFKADGWDYSWSFGLHLAAWTLILISSPIFYITAKPANKA